MEVSYGMICITMVTQALQMTSWKFRRDAHFPLSISLIPTLFFP